MPDDSFRRSDNLELFEPLPLLTAQPCSGFTHPSSVPSSRSRVAMCGLPVCRATSTRQFYLLAARTVDRNLCNFAFVALGSPGTAIGDRRGDRRRLAPGSVVRHLQDYVSSLEPQFVIWCFQLTAFCVTAAAPLPKRSHAPRLARRGALPRASGPKRRQMPIRISRHALSRRRSGVSEGTMRRARKATASNEPVETRRMGR